MDISRYAGVLAFVVYAVFSLLLLFRGKRSLRNGLLACAAAITALWSLTTTLHALDPGNWSTMDRALAVLRDASWFLVMIFMLRAVQPDGLLWRRLGLVAGVLALIDLAFAISRARIDLGIGVIGTFASTRLAVSIMGLVIAENLARNLPQQLLWSNKQLIVALSALFGYNIILRIPQFLIGASVESLTAAQPLVYAAVLPLLIVMAVRDDALQLKIHSSRRFVFHSATLIFAGILLQGTALAALYVRRFGGTPAIVLSITVGFSGFVAIILAISSRTVRSTIMTFVNENFFNYKYDYRLEWQKFIAAQSLSEEEGSSARALRVLADLLDSTGGILFTRHQSSSQFLAVANIAAHRHAESIDAGDRSLGELQRDDLPFVEIASVADTEVKRAWAAIADSAWLLVPLRYKDHLVAVAVLLHPRAPRRLDWEDRTLISLVSRQLAAQLVHEHVAQVLTDAQRVAAFNDRVAFALHDLKNTAAQLNLMIQNAERYGDNPDFREDMMATVRNCEERLRALISKLRDSDSPQIPNAEPGNKVDVREIVTRFASRNNGTSVSLEKLDNKPIYADAAAADALERALEHVVTNAIDASPPDGEVHLSVEEDCGRICVLVRDSGAGMSAEFIANELFRPLRTTKHKGLGIGAYQAREIMRHLDGGIEVQSTLGQGTTMRLFLPAASTSDIRADR